MELILGSHVYASDLASKSSPLSVSRTSISSFWLNASSKAWSQSSMMWFWPSDPVELHYCSMDRMIRRASLLHQFHVYHCNVFDWLHISHSCQSSERSPAAQLVDKVRHMEWEMTLAKSILRLDVWLKGLPIVCYKPMSQPIAPLIIQNHQAL